MTQFDPDEAARTPLGQCRVLRKVMQYRVVKLTRFSWWPPSKAVIECNISESSVFSLTSGPLAIEFDQGPVLGFASNPSSNSVVVWIERDESGLSQTPDTLAADEELFPISASDPKYSESRWQSLAGCKINRVSVLVRQPKSLRMAQLPNEVGLCFSFDNGVTLIAAHGLHDDSDDFVVIGYDAVASGILPELEEIVVDV